MRRYVSRLEPICELLRLEPFLEAVLRLNLMSLAPAQSKYFFQVMYFLHAESVKKITVNRRVADKSAETLIGVTEMSAVHIVAL